MKRDDLICYCYHVPLGKLVNFARRLRPQRASQMSQCLGAGTGCGWCIPILKRIHARCAADPGAEEHTTRAAEPEACPEDLWLVMTPEEYAAARQQYRQSGGAKNEF
jgi:NAD(P)H-nitrite reductase large subunit